MAGFQGERLAETPDTVTGEAASIKPERKRGRLAQSLADLRPEAIVPGPDVDLGIVQPESYGDEFKGKRALITGLSHFDGFGYHTAERLVDMGASVAFTYRTRTETVDQIEASLRERAERNGGKVVSLQADFADPKQVIGLVGKAVEGLKQGENDAGEADPGRLDLYFDNAANLAKGMTHDKDPQTIIDDLNVQVVSPKIILGEAAAQMRTNRGGKIVSVLSVSADGAIDQGDYAGGKAFKFGAGRTLALESAMERKKISVVFVAPALSPTSLTSEVPEKVATLLREIVGQDEDVPPADVADYLVFAASSHADSFNGRVIPVYKPMQKAPSAA